MRILSQTNDIQGYHGTVGTPTNMYDYRGERLFVGDVVCLITFGVDGRQLYNFGIEFVCEEDVSIANWTGKNHQYVMGIAETYNSDNFKVLDGIKLSSGKWREKFNTIDSDFRVYKVKDHSQLAIGEKIGFLSVVNISDYPTEKGGEEQLIGSINEILEKATAKLKEMYGDDFKFEDDDEFVFALNNGILFISFDNGMKIKIMLDTVIPLDMDFDLKAGEQE